MRVVKHCHRLSRGNSQQIQKSEYGKKFSSSDHLSTSKGSPLCKFSFIPLSFPTKYTLNNQKAFLFLTGSTKFQMWKREIIASITKPPKTARDLLAYNKPHFFSPKLNIHCISNSEVHVLPFSVWNNISSKKKYFDSFHSNRVINPIIIAKLTPCQSY